jgi:energy-coupling factor transporter ATP-binding protein EcfA2
MADENLQTFFETVGSQAESECVRRSNAVEAAPPSHSEPVGGQTGPSRAWAMSGERFWGISQSLETLPAGCYRGGMSPDVGLYLERQPLQTDSLILLPDSKSQAIVSEIRHFTTLRPAFAKRGLLYKRGVLLWGPPGSGKTSTLHLLMQVIVDQGGGIGVLIEHPEIATRCLQLIRRIEPSRQLIGILEDIDGLVSNYGVEQYLSLLDGESQIDNVVFVATTNYPERLDRRFVDRPSRFDTVEYVGMPTADARRVYLRHKEPDLPDEMITEMTEVSDGFSIAHLRELIILTQCFGRSVADAAERLSASRYRTPSSDRAPDRFGPGFAAGGRGRAALVGGKSCGRGAE